MSKKVIINVPMASRSSVTLEGQTPDAHRGIWFYDPEAVLPPGQIKVGDTVVFQSCSGMEIIAIGVVTEYASIDDCAKFCSRVNDRGFKWKEALDESTST